MIFKKYITSVVREGIETSVAGKLIERDELSAYCEDKYVFGESERVETGTIAEFEGSPEYKSEYHVKPPFGCEVSDVTMFGPGGTVVTRDGKILFESARNNRGDLVERFVQFLRNPKRIPRLLSGYKQLYAPRLFRGGFDFELAFPVTYPTHKSYYHWVVEYLPKLRTLERYRNETGNDPVVLIDPDPQDWMRESVDLLTDAEVIERPQSTIRIHKLVLPSHRNHHPDDFNPSPAEYRWLRDQMYDAVGVSERGGSRRIYISRKDADRRHVINENAVIERLNEYGFESYMLSDLQVRDQVELFAEAETIVAPHGAGLVNMIFSTDCEVLELISRDLVFPFYLCLTDHLEHEYQYLYCDSKNGRLEVDIQQLYCRLQDIFR
jgi:hypothetical protein